MKKSMPQIEELSVEEIKPYENNPRINDEAIPKVAASIRDFGWQQPIVIDKDGVIVAGHTRYLAALSLKMKHVPCVRASNLTPEQVNAYRLVDNKTNEYATWDSELLDKEIDALPMFDMKEYGFGFNAEAAEEVFDALASDDEEGSGSIDAEEVFKVTIEIPKSKKRKVQHWWNHCGKSMTTDFVLAEAGAQDVMEDYEDEEGDEEPDEAS